MSLQSEEALQELKQNAASLGYLDRYLQALEASEEVKVNQLAQAALFDSTQLDVARLQYGRLNMVRELRSRIRI